MQEIIREILNFALMLGVVILVLLVAGFITFRALKNAAEEKDRKESESRKD